MEVLTVQDGRSVGVEACPNLTEPSDLELVRRAREGQPDAFSLLVSRHQERLARHCSRYLDNTADVEDVTQITFANAYRHLGNFEPRCQFSTWLLRIASNACIDLLRDRKRKAARIVSTSSWPTAEQSGPAAQAAFDFPDDTFNPELRMEQAELSDAIQAALAGLPDKLRDAYLCREFEGLRYRDIAQRLGISVGAAKSRIFYARASLMKQLAPLYA